jgi:hypothetical protein
MMVNVLVLKVGLLDLSFLVVFPSFKNNRIR